MDSNRLEREKTFHTVRFMDYQSIFYDNHTYQSIKHKIKQALSFILPLCNRTIEVYIKSDVYFLHFRLTKFI